MKILYVITGLAQGGAERVVCDLAEKMFQKGYEVKIAYLTGDVLTRPIFNEIELIKIGLTSTISLPKAYLKLSIIVKKYQPDVVHSHMVHANLLMRLVRISTSMNKLICTAHSNNEGGALRMVGYGVTHRLADITTNVSRNAVNSFENKRAAPRGSMISVHNGIDLNKYLFDSKAKMKIIKELNIPDNYRIILTVGRFNDAKDYPNLLKSIFLLKKEVKYPFKLLIAGDGELRSEFENIIQELRLTNEVTLLGRRYDIPELMSTADLFVLASKYEGFGLVVAEAMACKCLIVATNCGGIPEVLGNSHFLVPVGDAFALKEKIKYAFKLTNKQKHDVIVENLKHVQKNFSLENIIEKWIILYNEK